MELCRVQLTENDARACIKNYITKRLSISCLRGVVVLLRDRSGMPDSIGVDVENNKRIVKIIRNVLYTTPTERRSKMLASVVRRFVEATRSEEVGNMSRKQEEKI